MPTKIFGTVRPQIFAGKMWYTVMHKIFVTPIYLKHRTDAHGNFRQCETIFFRRNLLYPLLSIKCFDTSNYLKHCRDAPRSFSVLRDPKFSQKKRDILYYTWNFSIPQLFWNIERMPTKIFGTRRPKNFAEKTCYFLLCIKIFDTPIYLKHRTDAHGNFRQCETKIFRRKFVIPPIIHKIFRYLKLSGTLRGCPKKFFGIMRSKYLAGKRDTLYYT